MNTDSKAEEIAGEGKYEDIVEKLRASGMFLAHIEKTRNEYSDRFSSCHFVMTEHDWEMLAVLGLYDLSTLEHSIRTFELAYRIITHPFVESSDKTVVIGSFFDTAKISLEQFLRAALFHDIGKVIIPREILHNALDDEEVLVKMFPEEKFEEKEKKQIQKAILQTLFESGIRPIDVVPLKEIFSGEKHAELLCELEKRGFSEMATLKDVIRMHEPESKRILASLGYVAEGELAGSHHNYKKETNRYCMSIHGVTFGVADLIRIADVTDALRSARWYKRSLSEVEVLFILIKDAEAGEINPFLTYLWVKDQYAKLQERKDPMMLMHEREEVHFIEMFLKKESRFA